jgi:DNA-binding CsgD family transcriptional regulator
VSAAVPVPRSSHVRRGVVALAGDWGHTGIAEELGDHHDVLRLHDADAPPARPVDWLLVGPGTPAGAAERLAAALRGTSPALRVAAVVPPGRWHEPRSCDVRVPDSAHPADLVTAMRLAQEGIAVAGRPSVPCPGRHDQRLTGREAELLRVLCAGLSNEQIARRMRISRRTVEFHLTRIFRKLGVASRVEAVIHAQRAGLPS